MSDLMREEFEQTAIESLVAEGYSVRSAVEVMERGSDGEYRSVRFNGSWWAWQASRECLVIDLPKEDLNIDYSGYVSLNEVEESIHAAGVKTK